MVRIIPMNETVIRGDTHPLAFVWDDANGDPVDVSGWDVFYTAKLHASLSDDQAAISYNSTDDTTAIIKSDSGGGTVDTITIYLLPAQTALLEPTEYLHEVQRVDSGDVWTFAQGKLTVNPDLTIGVTT